MFEGFWQRGTSDIIIHGSLLHNVAWVYRTITYFLIKRTESLPSAQQSHTLKFWASALRCHTVLEDKWDLAINQNLDEISFAKSQEPLLQKNSFPLSQSYSYIALFSSDLFWESFPGDLLWNQALYQWGVLINIINYITCTYLSEIATRCDFHVKSSD